jgi:uncharacterized protein YwqG
VAPTAGGYVAASLLPAVRWAIKREPDAAMDLGQSKFGGAPDLPAGSTWPMWTNRDGERRPLQFFAQLDLASATAAAPAPLGLPPDGLLSFFADFGLNGEGITGLYPWEQEGARIIHSPSDVRLSRCSLRMEPLPSAQLAPVGIWTWDATPPADQEMTDAEFDALDALDQQMEAELRSLVPRGCELSGRHQLGGHAKYIQHPVEEEVVQALAGCFAGSGGFDSSAWERARPQVREWRTILQLDSESHLEVMWGDVGTLWWAARHEDVAADRWDAAMFNFQCS